MILFADKTFESTFWQSSLFAIPYSVPSHYLNQRWHIISSTISNTDVYLRHPASMCYRANDGYDSRWKKVGIRMKTSSNGNIFRVTGHCAGNTPVTGEFSAQRPVTRSFDVFCDLRLNNWLSKQWCGWWFETLSRPLWRHSNGIWGASSLNRAKLKQM